jgi:adenylate kinase
MKRPFIFFLSGASGVGKTTIVAALKKHDSFVDCVFLHFDSIGIPSSDEMLDRSGSVEKWQEMATDRWIEKIVTE